MARITEILNDDVRFSAKILPAKVVRIEDIPPNDEVTKAFNELAEKVELGPQYANIDAENLEGIAFDHYEIVKGVLKIDPKEPMISTRLTSDVEVKIYYKNI